MKTSAIDKRGVTAKNTIQPVPILFSSQTIRSYTFYFKLEKTGVLDKS